MGQPRRFQPSRSARLSSGALSYTTLPEVLEHSTLRLSDVEHSEEATAGEGILVKLFRVLPKDTRPVGDSKRPLWLVSSPDASHESLSKWKGAQKSGAKTSKATKAGLLDERKAKVKLANGKAKGRRPPVRGKRTPLMSDERVKGDNVEPDDPSDEEEEGAENDNDEEVEEEGHGEEEEEEEEAEQGEAEEVEAEGSEAEAEEAEEEERLSPPADDDDMFGKDISGIRIIFTPPQEEEVPEERKQIQLCSPTKRTSPPPMLPALDFGFGQEDDEADDDSMDVIPFNFGRALTEERKPSPPLLSERTAPVPTATMMTPPSSLPRASSPAVTVSQRPASPSMIPRPASPAASSIPRLAKVASTAVGTPIKSPPSRAATLPVSPSASFVTPPPKRAGTIMSFIPTPVSSPSPMRAASGGAARPKVAIAP